MNKNLDLTKILENCPYGTKLFNTEHGYVKFLCIDGNAENYPIIVKGKRECYYAFTKDGYSCNKEYRDKYAEPSLYPSYDQRDWSKFVPTCETKKEVVEVTLHPFDKVLVRDDSQSPWQAQFVSFITVDGIETINGEAWCLGVPYNKDTAHLLGTSDKPKIDYEIEFSKEFKEE